MFSKFSIMKHAIFTLFLLASSGAKADIYTIMLDPTLSTGFGGSVIYNSITGFSDISNLSLNNDYGVSKISDGTLRLSDSVILMKDFGFIISYQFKTDPIAPNGATLPSLIGLGSQFIPNGQEHLDGRIYITGGSYGSAAGTLLYTWADFSWANGAGPAGSYQLSETHGVVKYTIASSVPEPNTSAMLIIGMLGLLGYSRRQQT